LRLCQAAIIDKDTSKRLIANARPPALLLAALFRLSLQVKGGVLCAGARITQAAPFSHTTSEKGVMQSASAVRLEHCQISL
jgi:hypothetical protein|tara:strand:- start:13834 stop:14076 length:243 start_codon:yes stop_codon:yes gene_type:complete